MKGKDKGEGLGEVNGFLGRDTTFEGKLDFKGAVRIEGNFKGEIRTPDFLIVGEGARVEGDVYVGTAIVQGEVVGNIRATTKVELRSTARVKGDLTTPSLVIHEGAFFEGNCKMEGTGGGEPLGD